MGQTQLRECRAALQAGATGIDETRQDERHKRLVALVRALPSHGEVRQHLSLEVRGRRFGGSSTTTMETDAWRSTAGRLRVQTVPLPCCTRPVHLRPRRTSQAGWPSGDLPEVDRAEALQPV
jgi:hypothetical protein